MTVWYVDRIGTESSVDFSASRPTTEARADEDSTPLDQYPLSSPARLNDWPFLWRLGVTERKQQCQIIDDSQYTADGQGHAGELTEARDAAARGGADR